jgi:hypothetical protein
MFLDGCTNLGRGIVFTKKYREKIHDLLQVYGLQPLSNETIAGCSICKERFGAKG